MQYHNMINTESVDSQILGILVVIPVTGSKTEPIIATFEKCDKCGRLQQGYGEFCSSCGGKFIEVTESPMNYRGDIEEQNVPVPDIRAEMKELGIDNHVTFGEDSIGKDFVEDDCNWVFIVKEYKTLGDDTYFRPFLEELDVQQIQNDLAEAKEKFKDVITKYNGKVVFGLTGDHVDW